MKVKFKTVLLLLLLVAAVLCAGCSSSGGSGSASTYTVADDTGDWGYPSPYAHYSRGPGYIRMSMIFDTLVWKDEEGYVPALAREWSYNKNKKAYTFNLRKGVTWHDGENFNADDVVFTFNYIKEHPYSWVDGSKIKRVEAAGDYKVKIYLEEPYAPFLSNIAGTMPVLPEHVYRGVENPKQFRGEKALTGTGPFKLLDYNKEHGSYLYAANEDYYGGKPAVDRLKFIKVSREMSLAALQQGEVNAAEVPPETVKELKKKGLEVIQSPYQWNAKLLFNHREKPFSRQKFRQALAYAINRNEIVDIALRGHGVAASPGMLPPDSYWHNPDVKQYEYDPAKTRSMLQELGYETAGKKVIAPGGDPLELKLLTSPRFSREAEIIKEQLGEAGIKVDIRSLEAKTVDTRVGSWKFDLALTGHGGLGGDPVILNQMILGPSFNSARYRANEQLADLLHRQVKEMDREKRRELVFAAQEIYAKELPALSIYYPSWYWGHDGKLPLYYTRGGVATGIPLPLNKHCFIR